MCRGRDPEVCPSLESLHQKLPVTQNSRLKGLGGEHNKAKIRGKNEASARGTAKEGSQGGARGSQQGGGSGQAEASRGQ